MSMFEMPKRKKNGGNGGMSDDAKTRIVLSTLYNLCMVLDALKLIEMWKTDLVGDPTQVISGVPSKIARGLDRNDPTMITFLKSIGIDPDKKNADQDLKLVEKECRSYLQRLSPPVSAPLEEA